MKIVKKIVLNKYFLSILGIGLFFLLWMAVYYLAGATRVIFPDPSETIEEMFLYLEDPYTYKCIWGSLRRMLYGFGVGALAAILVGIIVGNFLKLKYVFNPTMIALKAVPTAALVFLFMVLAGLKKAPIYIVALIVFPIVYEATVAGYSSIDEYVLKSSRVDGATFIKSNLKIRLPLAMPTIMLGLISSFALSFKIEIMAEVISGSSGDGIGKVIQTSYTYSSNGMVPTFAYSLIAIIVMLLITLLLDIVKKILKLKA